MKLLGSGLLFLSAITRFGVVALYITQFGLMDSLAGTTGTTKPAGPADPAGTKGTSTAVSVGTLNATSVCGSPTSANSGTSSAPIFNSGFPASLGVFATCQFRFSQSPGGSLHSGSTNTITLTPCPLGLAGTDLHHPVYIGGGLGAAEAPVITGGTCTSGAASGTITFTPANDHSGAWTVQSATSGIEECFNYAYNSSGAATGAAGACYTPQGQWPIYATLYDYKLVGWEGDGGTSEIDIEFNGADGIVVGPDTFVTGNWANVHGLRAVYMAGGGAPHFAASNNIWFFRNISDGNVYDVQSFLGYEGFRFEQSVRVKYANIYSNAARYAYHWTGTPSEVNAGQMVNFYGTIQSGGTAALFDGVLAGLSLSNFIIEAPRGSSSTNGMMLLPSTNNVFNELQVTNGNIDNFASSALVYGYLSTPQQNEGSTHEFSNVRFTTSGTSTSPVILINAPFYGISFSNCTIYNSGTGDGLTLAGAQRVTWTGGHIDVNSSTGRPIVIEAGSGGEIVSDFLLSGTEVGTNGAVPTNNVATDAAAHIRLFFTGSNFNASGGLSGFSAVTNSFFDLSNHGLPVPTIASASTVTLTPPVPVFFVSGATALRTIKGGATSETVRLIFTDASPGGVTTGGNVQRAQAAMQNQSISLTFISPNWY